LIECLGVFFSSFILTCAFQEGQSKVHIGDFLSPDGGERFSPRLGKRYANRQSGDWRSRVHFRSERLRRLLIALPFEETS
jgi:hypothetical protein